MRQERKMKETQKRKVEKRREKQLENFKSKVLLQNKEGLEKLLAWDLNAFEIIRLKIPNTETPNRNLSFFDKQTCNLM
jgi:hypothetical protein